MKGIDISQHNGEIDWDKVKSDKNVDFVILRCGFGIEAPNQEDRRFAENYAACKRLGIPVGAYHYSYAQSVGDAEKEAEFCLKLIGGKQFDFPIFYDVEERAHVERGCCDDVAAAFCNKLEAAGYFAGVYTFDSFAKTNLTDKTKKRYAMWIARIGGVPVYSRYGIHQHSWRGSISGIDGNVDLDVSCIDYPKIIKSKHLNGFAEAEKRFKVSAVIKGVSSEEADRIQRVCSEMDMTAVKTEV